jgi:hypothetical protein
MVEFVESFFIKFERLELPFTSWAPLPGNEDDPRIIAETRQYLRDFDRLNAATTTARELYDAMLEIYPDRVNPGSLWGAANAAKKAAS